ncbi:MAG: ATP-binding protein, partial [Verrucomicrobiota bacterium]
MKNPDFKRQIIVPLLTVITVIIIAVAWYTSHKILELNRTGQAEALKREAELVTSFISPRLAELPREKWAEIIADATDKLAPATRVTIVDMGGEIIAAPRLKSELHTTEVLSNSPEIQSALRGLSTDGRGSSPFTDEDSFYVAFPLRRDETITGAIRIERPVDAIGKSPQTLIWHLMLVSAGAGLIAAGTILFLAKHMTRPLYTIQHRLEEFAKGDLAARVPAFQTRQFNIMAKTMNEMAKRLDESMQTVKQQRNEVEAVLSSMTEGVLAIDTQQKVFRINQAAADMLEVRSSEVLGKTLQSTIRNSKIQELLATALFNDKSVEGEAVIYEYPEKYIKVKSSVIKKAGGEKMGAVAVLNNVTQMRNLENMRRDFVANVSHEIRTPITSIRGFIETLRDGALDNRKDAEHFLDIILRHTERLDAIINDLLTLSRVENEEAGNVLSFEKQNLKNVLNSASRIVRQKATEKDITIKIESPPDITVRIHPVLFEQAIINLLDNAINYSNCKDTVSVRTETTEEELIIEVIDRGCGIASEHLARIFERFYRVNKGRSRDLGGTGLGLAIVKHIANIHGGRVTVESALNQGSTFRFHLPRILHGK